jgi:DNA polymerase III alpha subunit
MSARALVSGSITRIQHRMGKSGRAFIAIILSDRANVSAVYAFSARMMAEVDRLLVEGDRVAFSGRIWERDGRTIGLIPDSFLTSYGIRDSKRSAADLAAEEQTRRAEELPLLYSPTPKKRA